MLNISNLVITDYNTKISDLEKKLTDHNHGKYITISEFNTLAADVILQCKISTNKFNNKDRF